MQDLPTPKNSYRLPVSVDKETKDNLEALSERFGISQASIARLILRSTLKTMCILTSSQSKRGEKSYVK